MQYLLFVGTSDEAPTGEVEGVMDIEDWVDEYDAKGVRKFGERLKPAADARTVRVREGEVLVTDGPFVEGKEYIAGFDLIECDSMEDAIEVARRHPMASHGLIEIRQLWPWEG